MRPSLSDRMQVVVILHPGGPEVLKGATRLLPRPRADEVLVRVAAADVNRPDCFQRVGVNPPRPGASDLPGLEVAGTVVECAENARQWRLGDQVCALTPGGGPSQEFKTKEISNDLHYVSQRRSLATLGSPLKIYSLIRR